MIDYEYVNRRFADLSMSLLAPAFRKMALTFCITPKDFYDALEMNNALKGFDDYDGEHKERIDKYRLRLIRLTKRLNAVKRDITKNDELFEKKVYDCQLNESMVVSYQYLAQAIGDTYIEKVHKSVLLRSIDIGDRDGFSLVEFALLMCLLLSIQGRSVGRLNAAVNTEYELRRARARFGKMKAVLFSAELENILINLMLDYLAEYYQKNYEDRLSKHLTKYWLPKKRRHLKTARYAVKRYGNEIDNIYYKDADYDSLDAADLIRLFRENEDIARTQWLFFVVLPMTEAYLDGVLPLNVCEFTKFVSGINGKSEIPMVLNIQRFLLNSDTVSPQIKDHIKNMPPSYYDATIEDYLVAQRLAQAIKGYVAEVQKAVVALLETLPEAQIAGKQGLWHYLSRL